MIDRGAAQLLSLTGQVAVVTGVSAGLGRTIAERLAEAGASLVMQYRTDGGAAQSAVEAISAGGGAAVAIRAELTDPAEGAALMLMAHERVGRFSILVNNAGAYPMHSLPETQYEDWTAVFRANLDTAFLTTTAALPYLPRGSAIVNVSSIAGVVPSPLQGHYSSAKAALTMFTRASAAELGPRGIRVNSVSPGLIERDALRRDWPDGVERWLQRAPLGRLGRPGDVADACLFLASPAAAWITGQNLIVDGGMTVAPLY